MGAYSFKPQFEADIMADRKHHTIRDKRKDGRVPKVGEVLSLYVGMRTKACRLLKRRRCVRVQEVEISLTNVVSIDGESLGWDECQLLAKSDGFRSFAEMMDFWEGRLPFLGDMPHWESDAENAKNPVPDPKAHRPATGSARRANTRRARRPAAPA